MTITMRGTLTKLIASLPQLNHAHRFSEEQSTELKSQNVDYQLRLLDEGGMIESNLGEYYALNTLVGASVSIRPLGRITCLYCGTQVKKSYSDGYCYPCFVDQPTAAECIIRPELCLAHEGIGRDPEWEKTFHLQPHLVYLALSNKYKVGVTRDWPTRWLDQGADAIKVIAETPYRQLAGQIEVELSKYYSDKLSWQRMLKDERLLNANLNQEADRCLNLLPPELSQYGTPKSSILWLNYPKVESPTKVKSIKLDTLSYDSPLVGRLVGIKGQYLIFDEGRVFNARAHSGYHVEISSRALSLV